MNVIEISQTFGVDNLRPGHREKPVPGEGQVLVRLVAAALNFRDLGVINGERGFAPPLIPLSDGVGYIEAIGANAGGWRIGDRVSSIFVPGWRDGPIPAVDPLPTLGGPLDGTLAGYAAWDADSLVAAPNGLDDLEAAALPCAGVSAWNGLFDAGRLRPDQTVLLQGTGGVSLFALAFAKAAGSRVVHLSSSDAKLDRLRTLGADHVINYREQRDWSRAVREIVPGGVDLVIDVGGVSSLTQSFLAVRNGGRVSAIGHRGQSDTPVETGLISAKGLTVQGLRVGNRRHHRDMVAFIEKHGLRPIIDRVFGVDDIVPALHYFEQGRHFGKVVIDLSSLHAGETP